MKKTFFLRFFLLIASLLLALSVLTLAPNAEEDDRPLIEWTVSADGKTLSDGTREFTLYTLPVDSTWRPILSCYYYSQSQIEIKETNTVQTAEITAPTRGADIVCVSLGSKNNVYVTEAAKAELDAFFAQRKDALYKLCRSSYYTAALEASTAEALGSEFSEISEVDVTVLANLEHYSVLTYDKTGSIRLTLGDVYCFENGSVGFIDYSMLENSHFDADGNFSYRSGTAPVIMLSGDITTSIKNAVQSIDYTYPDTEFESDTDFFANLLPLFWAIYALIGYILPLIPLFLGLILPHSQKQGKPKRWYALAILAAVWIVLATVILLILL